METSWSERSCAWRQGDPGVVGGWRREEGSEVDRKVFSFQMATVRLVLRDFVLLTAQRYLM